MCEASWLENMMQIGIAPQPNALILIGVGFIALARIARNLLIENHERPQGTVPLARSVVYGRSEQFSRHRGQLPSSELKAQRLLAELIPRQARAYRRMGMIEIRSTLFPELLYRIYPDRITEVFEDGAVVGTACIHTRDPLFPPTDRVLAEYFLLKGDESSYLRIANFSRRF